MSSEALERAEALLAVEPGSNVKSAAWWFAAARDMAREVAKLEAALAVAREREQRLRGALQQIANHNVRAPVTGTSADDPCDWHCTAQQRDLARAALVDEPAAATLAEPGGTARSTEGTKTPFEPASDSPGSASAAADERSEQ